MKYLLLGISLCSLWFCDSIRAEEQVKEIVVTATRSDKEQMKVPENIQVITESDIAKSGSQTVSDVLRTGTNLVVRDVTGSGKTVEVDIRGFGAVAPTNVLVLVDGRRVTQVDLSGTDWSQIPLDSVSRIEVISGAGSVLYGDNATAGVVNIITKQGFGPVRGELKSLAGSYGMNSFLGQVHGGNENFSFSASQRSLQTNGYRKNSFLNTEDGNARFGMKFSDKLNIDFSLGSHNDTYGLPGYLTKNEIKTLGRRHTNSPDDWAETQDIYQKIQVKNKFDIGTIVTDLTIRNRKSQLEWISWAWSDIQHVESVHFTPRYIMELPLANIPFKFTGGVDILNDRGYQESADFLAKKQELGLYGLGEFTFNKALNLSLGYRHDLVKYHFNAPVEDIKKRDKNGVGQIGLSYLYNPQGSVYCNYAQNFRNPVVDEYFDTWAGLNTKLKPQSGNQAEVGIKQGINKQVYGTLSLFRIDIDDEIFYNKPIPPFGINENYDGQTRRQGIETSLSYKPVDIIKTTINYTYTNAMFRGGMYSGNQVPGVPHNKASAILNVEFIKSLNFNLQTNYVGRQYMISDLNNTAPKLPYYSTVDTKIMYEKNNISAFIGMNNILNKKYMDYGVVDATATLQVFYPAPERNYGVGLSINF